MNKFHLIFWILLLKNLFPYEGKIEYPNFVPFYLYSKANLSEAKKHMERLILVLLQDHLSLLSQVEWNFRYPQTMVYPTTVKEEDPFFNYFVTQKKLMPVKLIYAQEFSQKDFFAFLEKKGGFHLFLAIEENPLVLEAKLYRIKDKILEKKILLIENEILEQLAQLAYEIRLEILGKNASEIYLNSKPERASVYLNGIFVGKTPLPLKALATGDYELRLQKEGYETLTKNFTLREKEKLELNETLLPQKGEAFLEVNSNPPGAKVYLNATYVGQTPISLANLPYGNVRLLISLENYKEEIYVANLSQENPKESLKIKLIPKTDEEFFKPNPTILGPLTYYDLFVTGLFFSGGFAGISLYYAVQRDNTRDKMLSELSTTNTNFFTENDKQIFAEKMPVIEKYNRLSQSFLVACGISLLGSFYFFYKYLASYEPPMASVHSKKTNYLAFNIYSQGNSLNWSYSFSF